MKSIAYPLFVSLDLFICKPAISQGNMMPKFVWPANCPAAKCYLQGKLCLKGQGGGFGQGDGY